MAARLDALHGFGRAGVRQERGAAAEALRASPARFVRRQVRVTPYPHEDAGWIIANSATEVCLFSSDFPHVEGGRNPLKRFDELLADTPRTSIDRFYCDNFIDLMGEGLAADLRKPRSHRHSRHEKSPAVSGGAFPLST